MPRFIVELCRHTVRIRNATVKVAAPNEDAIMEEDWTDDYVNGGWSGRIVMSQW